LKPPVGEDALDRAQADGKMGLAQLLGDDLGRGLRVQEAVPQHLARGLLGAAVVGFGAGLFGQERRQAAGLKGAEELVIALAGITVALGHRTNAGLLALAFDQHKKLVGQLVCGIQR